MKTPEPEKPSKKQKLQQTLAVPKLTVSVYEDEETSDDDEDSDDDQNVCNDPDWKKTPLYRRIRQITKVTIFITRVITHNRRYINLY